MHKTARRTTEYFVTLQEFFQHFFHWPIFELFTELFCIFLLKYTSE